MKLDVLSRPFPFNNGFKKAIISALLFGLFIFLFLFLFQPFGISNYSSENKIFDILGFGLVTFVLLFSSYLLFKFLFPRWFSEKTWTVGKNMSYTLYILFLIGCGNFFYSVNMGFLPLTFKGILFYQFWTFLVGIFPVTISTFIIYSRSLKRSISQATQLNDSLHNYSSKRGQRVLIPSQNKSEDLWIDINQLLSIKSVENYVEVYVMESEELKKVILRNTLRNIQFVLKEYPFLEQCHRSFLVNLEKVECFKGNAQGLTLNFEIPDFEIPVSRSYVKEIKEKLQQTV